MRLILAGLLALLVSACSPDSAVETLLTPEERQLIGTALDDVSRGNGAALSSKVSPDIADELETALPAMRRAIPPTPRELTVLSVNFMSGGGSRTAEAIYQVEGLSSWALVRAVTITQGDRTTLAGLHIERTAVEPSKLNAFRLADATPGGWAMLVAMIAAVGLTIAALIRIWRSGRFKRRWLWTLGALVGITTLRMSWTTGEWSFQPISFQILSVSAVKTPVFAPWVLGVSVPLVALIALLWRDEDAAVFGSPEPDFPESPA